MSDDWHLNETYKSLITISVEAFKFCALANGGAAVAILAYLGNVAAKIDVTTPIGIRCSMGAFLFGLVTCGLSMVCAYLTQLQLFNEEKLQRVPEELRGNSISHAAFLRPALIFLVASLMAFCEGSLLAVLSF
ncbi:TPA: hypothetical protein ACSP84_003002 [Aeromonas veronii]